MGTSPLKGRGFSREKAPRTHTEYSGLEHLWSHNAQQDWMKYGQGELWDVTKCIYSVTLLKHSFKDIFGIFITYYYSIFF